MDGDYERSFIAWINSFNRDSSTPAVSLSDLTSGDLLLTIVRTVLVGDVTGRVESDADTGWLGVFALMKPAGLLEEGAEPPGAVTPHEDKVALVRTSLEALLRYAVGEQCSCQEIIINKILTLDPEVQMGLRNVILGQQQQQHELSFEVATPSRESVREDERLFDVSPVHSIRSKIESSPIVSDHALGLSSEGLESDERSLGSNFSSLEGDQRERAAPIGPKKQQNSYGASSKWVTVAASDFGSTSMPEAPDLQAEITRLEDKLADTVSAYSRSLEIMRNERDAAVAREQELSDTVWQAKQEEERAARLREDEVIEMEKDIHGKYETQIIGLQQRASEAEEKVFRLKSLEEEVMELRDQVDILKPAEAKLTMMEETLSRYRERVEELGDLPGQLKREEAAHAEAIDRYLTLETEVKQVPVLRRQLQNFRLSKTEMEMTNRDQARTLKLAQEDVARLSSELLSLRASSDEVKNEHRRLQEELARRDTEEAQQEKGGLGIGEGMSELNPELSEELARLRHDNKELNAQMDYNTVETIQDLEQKAEDANCLADSFHATLASERELRATAEASLAEARARIMELEAEIVTMRREHEENLVRLQDEANAAAAKAAADLAASHKEAREMLAVAEEAAREGLESERRAAGERLAEFKRDAEDVAEGLQREMAAAEEAAVLRAENAWKERCEERARLEAEVAEVHEAAARQREHAMEEKLAAGEAHALKVKEIEDILSRERNEVAEREERAVQELVELRQGFEGELARAKCESEEKLEGVKISATRDLMEARKETKQEELGRLEEAQRKEEVMAENMRLHEKLTAGERAALSAIEKLKADKKTLKQECALKLVQQNDNHDTQMAALNAKFDQYRRSHTVGDNDYHQDMNKWERIKTLNENKIRDLERQREQWHKDQRRLEREKTFYWGQAEELRMRLMETRGAEDPMKAADYAQLVVQNKELVEENRRLREGQQVSREGGLTGASVRGQGRWGGGGVAAMRAEHESEMNAIKKEKQNLLMKYHDKANKMNAQEKENDELREENTKLQNDVIKFRLICERQKREFQESLSSVALMSPSSGSSSDHNACMPKENQPNKASSKKRVHHRDENSVIEIQSKRRDSSPEGVLPSVVDEGFAEVPMAVHGAGPEEGVPVDCKQS